MKKLDSLEDLVRAVLFEDNNEIKIAMSGSIHQEMTCELYDQVVKILRDK